MGGEIKEEKDRDYGCSAEHLCSAIEMRICLWVLRSYNQNIPYITYYNIVEIYFLNYKLYTRRILQMIIT